MSEPDAAFLTLRIGRADLVRWLDAQPPKATRWQDWRGIGGSWHFDDGVMDILDIPDAELAAKLKQCEADLAAYPTNRDALDGVLDFAGTLEFGRACYDAAAGHFTAGTLFFSENLMEQVVFLTLARGAADFLPPDGSGVAVIKNYVFGTPDEEDTRAALRLGPGGASGFVPDAEKADAARAFQPLVDAMLQSPDPPVSVSELDALR